MRRNLAMRVQYYLTARQQDRRRAMILRCLAVVVAFVTAYALIMPAITQSNALLCGMEAHTHTEDCWTVELAAPQPELVCAVGQSGEIVIHTHNPDCYDQNGRLACPLPERELHIHNSNCYREQRELICEELQSLGHAHSSSCYTYVRGELTCKLEEEAGHVHTDACWSVEQSDTPSCGQTEGGHTHSSACYMVEWGDTPECGLEEEAGHIHSNACYMSERSDIPACGQDEGADVLDEEGNLLQSGHTHTVDCYPEDRVLVCTEEENRGHTHTKACYPKEEVLVCALEEGWEHIHTDACYPEVRTLVCQEETQGHTHSDSCYDWLQELRCQEPEREPGHIHTNECYKITELLACWKEELILHTHSEESCYYYNEETEELELICDKPEIMVHQHTAECFFTPDREPSEVEVLACGMEEHIHTEECYVDILPKEEDIYFCGLTEHIHTEECYFESGTLRCTLTEHSHDSVCLEKPPEVVEIPEGPTSVELDDYFDYETDAFHATFHVMGTAVLSDAEDSTPPSYNGGTSSPPSYSGGTGTPPSYSDGDVPPEDGNLEDADSEAPSGSGSTDEAGLADYGSNDEAESSDYNGYVDVGDADYEHEPQPLDGAEPVADGNDPVQSLPERPPVRVEFLVSEADEDTEEYRRIKASVPESDTEQMILSVLTFDVASSDGREVDLSQCQIEAEVIFTQELVDSLINAGSEVMAIDENGQPEEFGEVAEVTEILLGAYSDETEKELSTVRVNEETVNVGHPVAMRFRLAPQTRTMALTAQAGQFPEFTVEYYANLNRPATSADATAGMELITNNGTVSTKADSLPFINTDGVGTPTNGGTLSVTNLLLDKAGNVLFVNKMTEIFQSAKMQYNSIEPEALKTNNLGTVVNASGKVHYKLTEIRVYPEGSKDERGNEKTDYVSYTEAQFNNLEFTNSPKTAYEDETGNTLLITDSLVVRMVYETESDQQDYAATFYDYDITDGLVDDKYSSAANGINSDKKEDGTGVNPDANNVKFAFGNANTGTNYGAVKWNGNELNKFNSAGSGYEGCTFGIVSGLNSDGTPHFNMPAPKIFGSEAQVGKHYYDNYSLHFIQAGDTYTLSAVNGSAKAQNLEQFKHPGIYDGVHHSKTIWTNHFWPLDEIQNADPPFGSANNQYTFGTTGTPPSDNGDDHNSFFGMSFAVTFTLQKEYVGPLEYYFYGDDDMWVFLDGKLVCDIGGVHRSVGEYVDLWDYISENRESDESHRLDFFYTERGASGSTCWMQFTVPDMIPAPQFTPPTETDNYLRIEKKVEGDESRKDEEFNFNLVLKGTGDVFTLRKYSRNVLNDKGEPTLIDESQSVQGNSSEGLNFTLKDGEYVLLYPLPSHVTYALTETSPGTDCKTSFQVNGGREQVGSGCGGSMSDGQKTTVDVVCTNTFYYQLPATGGPGAILYTWAGALLIAACGLWYKKQNSKGGTAAE